jgi:hypothetical protein
VLFKLKTLAVSCTWPKFGNSSFKMAVFPCTNCTNVIFTNSIVTSQACVALHPLPIGSTAFVLYYVLLTLPQKFVVGQSKLELNS